MSNPGEHVADEEALVLGFGDIGAEALGTVGGKGANLAWMAQAGLPVPPGFCVSTEFTCT
ncbi:MAG TPA: PEP/pyruvate-binding domain-containing protein [Candidatus Methylomirabilis sp.]|nr:PEP/pyruvate-binding domain-containing protein [Candidatus Methylomirabilis sp.]